MRYYVKRNWPAATYLRHRMIKLTAILFLSLMVFVTLSKSLQLAGVGYEQLIDTDEKHKEAKEKKELNEFVHPADKLMIAPNQANRLYLTTISLFLPRPSLAKPSPPPDLYR